MTTGLILLCLALNLSLVVSLAHWSHPGLNTQTSIQIQIQRHRHSFSLAKQHSSSLGSCMKGDHESHMPSVPITWRAELNLTLRCRLVVELGLCTACAEMPCCHRPRGSTAVFACSWSHMLETEGAWQMDGSDDNYIANDDVLLYSVCATYGSVCRGWLTMYKAR